MRWCMRKGGMGVVSLDVWIWKQEAPTAQPPIAGGDRPETATVRGHLARQRGATTSRTPPSPRGLSIGRFVCILLIDRQSGEARG